MQGPPIASYLSSLSSFDHFRNFKKCAVGLGGVFHSDVMRQRLAQSVADVVPYSACEAIASLTRIVNTIPIRDLDHGYDPVGVQFIQPVDVIKNRVQVVEHASALVSGQF